MPSYNLIVKCEMFGLGNKVQYGQGRTGGSRKTYKKENSRVAARRLACMKWIADGPITGQVPITHKKA